MAVCRECTKIGHAVPWTAGASLITLSGPSGFAPGGFRTLVWMPFAARSSRRILFTSRRDKFVNARRHVNRTNGLHLAGSLLY